MKKDIHPDNYRFVVFKDMSCEHCFLTRSTAPSKETILWEDGNEYPLIKLEISDQSHPFYTGKMKLVDTAGRVDKFRSKYKKHIKNTEASTEAPVKEEPTPKPTEPVVAEEAPAVEAKEDIQVEEEPTTEAQEEIKLEDETTEENNEPVEAEESADDSEGEQTTDEETPAAEENTEGETGENSKSE